MSRFHPPFLAFAAAVVLSSCGSAPPPPPPPSATRDLAALDTVTSSIMGMPVTTASAEARSHFLQGQRELDLARNFEALDHFKLAVAADSTFAIAYLNIATTGNSLGNIETGLNKSAEARAAYEKALSLAPKFAVAHIAIGTSYLFGEPRDFNQALQHYQAAEALAPNEPSMHDFVGDAQRALNNLSQARAEYTRGHVLNPRDAGMLQQRGHVNSFAGDFDAARSDYDSAMAVGRGNERGFFAPFRAYVSVYAGNAPGAIVELNKLVAQADGMGLPDPVTVKINALSNVALIG